MAKYTKRAALAHIRQIATMCLVREQDTLALSDSQVAANLHEIADTNHKYVRDCGAESLSGIVSDLRISLLRRLQKILSRVEQMDAALREANY